MKNMNPFTRVKNVCPIIGGSSLLLLASVLEGAGVAALKEQKFHDDSAAKPLVYTEMKDQGAPFVIFHVGGKATSIEKSKIAAMVDVPSAIPDQILDESSITPLRTSLKNMTSFSERFGHMKPLLEKHIAAVSAHIDKYDSGNLRVNGNWIKKSDFESNIKKSQLVNKNTSEKNEIKTKSGKIYSDYSFKNADVTGIKIIYSAGIATIQWDDIPENLKAEFGFEEVMRIEEKRIIAVNKEIADLRVELDDLIKNAKSPMGDSKAEQTFLRYQKIKSKLGTMSSDGLTSSDIKEIFGVPDSTSIAKNAIRNDLSSLTGDLAAIYQGRPKPIGIWMDVKQWDYYSRLKNSTTGKLETLTFLFYLDTKLAGVRSEDGDKFLKYTFEK